MRVGHPKAGGRVKGTPNKRTTLSRLLAAADEADAEGRTTRTRIALSRLRDADEIIDRSGCDPLEKLIAIGNNPKTPVDVRVRCWSEVASYRYPKRKALELSRADDKSNKPVLPEWLLQDFKDQRMNSLPAAPSGNTIHYPPSGDSTEIKQPDLKDTQALSAVESPEPSPTKLSFYRN